MFKFLFGTKTGSEAVKETARDTAKRSLQELNEVLASLGDIPRISIGAGDAVIVIDWPEQMPGEAKALPAPDPQEISSDVKPDEANK